MGIFRNEWFKAMRPRTTFLAMLVELVGFAILGENRPPWLVIVSVIALVASAVPLTMLVNDWHDQTSDQMQGKRDLAARKSAKFLAFTTFFFVVSVSLTLYMFSISTSYGTLSVLLLIAGLVYSQIQRIKYMPDTYVALTTAGTLLYPIIVHSTIQGVLLLIAVALFVYGRENFKNLLDMEVDKLGGKWTWATACDDNGKTAKIIAIICYVLALPFFYWAAIIALNNAILLFIVLATVPLLARSLYMFYKDRDNRIAKRWSDMAVLISLVVMLDPISLVKEFLP